MKKIVFIVLVALLVLSCSEDQETNTVQVNNVISVEGNWKLTGYTTDEETDFNNDSTPTTNLITESGCYSNSKLEFNGDNTALFSMDTAVTNLSFVEGEDGAEGSYQYTVECSTEATIENATYTANANSVVLTLASGEAITFVKSGNTLTAYMPNKVEVKTQTDGAITSSLVGVTLVYTKQ
jgi:hypothetical protein